MAAFNRNCVNEARKTEGKQHYQFFASLGREKSSSFDYNLIYATINGALLPVVSDKFWEMVCMQRAAYRLNSDYNIDLEMTVLIHPAKAF